MSRPRTDRAEQIRQFHEQGISTKEICALLGIAKSTVQWHLAEYRRRHGEPPVQLQLYRATLNAKPLIEIIDRRVAEMQDEINAGLKQLCELRNLQERAIQRIKASGKVSYLTADEILCRLGVPTATVYPYEQMTLEESA